MKHPLMLKRNGGNYGDGVSMKLKDLLNELSVIEKIVIEKIDDKDYEVVYYNEHDYVELGIDKLIVLDNKIILTDNDGFKELLKDKCNNE